MRRKGINNYGHGGLTHRGGRYPSNLEMAAGTFFRPSERPPMRRMRRRSAILAAMAAAVLISAGCVSAPAAQATDPQPVGAGTGWTLLNSLDGQEIYSTFNLEPLTGDDCNNEDAQGSVSVDSLGNLKLTTYADSDACAEVASPWDIAPGTILGKPYEVFIEWRASIPFNSWAALWLTGGSPWPTNGEIDAAEVLEPGKLCQTFHYGPKSDPHVIGGDLTCQSPPFASGTWHTYGVEWTSDDVIIYYDGDQVFSTGQTSNVTTAPEEVLMDVVNAGWVGTSGPEASLYINYVRTWARYCPCS